MLTQLCSHLRNYFLADYSNPDRYIHHGTFVIADSEIQELPFLLPGQYYRVIGSVFNDGVWQYRPGADAPHMKDETFDGTIWAMRVPPEIISLAADIKAWIADNGAALNSPYQSESFGGYSYGKRSGYGWQDQFASRMAPYRRLSVL